MANKLLSLVKLASTFGLSALGAGPLSLLPIQAVGNLLEKLIGKEVINQIGELSGDVVGELAGEYTSEFLKSLSRAPDQDLRRLYLLALKEALERERDHLRQSHGEKILFSEGKRDLPKDQEKLFALWLEKIEEALKDEIERDLLFESGPVLDQIVGAKTDDEYQDLWWSFLRKTLERWNERKPLPEDLSHYLRKDLPDRIAESLNELLADEKHARALNKYQADFLNLLLKSVSRLEKQAARHEQKTDISNEKLNVIIKLLLEMHGKVTAQPDGKRSPAYPIHRIGRAPNPHFVGREQLLEEIHQTLSEGKTAALTAIHGLGGVGKTQLAAEFAHANKDQYQIIWWIASEETATIASDFEKLATELCLPEKETRQIAVIVEAVMRELNGRDDWLLIFDNAPNPMALRGYLPQNREGHALVTSRDPNWGWLARKIEVQELDPADSKKFLLERTGEKDDRAAELLAKELGHLPLALEQAAAYIEASEETLAGYLELFRLRRQELWAEEKQPVDYPDTVATTWLISFEEAERESAEAASLMRLCAYFAPDDIPLQMIRDGAEHLPDELAAMMTDKIAFNKAIAALRRYSLIEREDHSLSVHRLVQAVTRDRLEEEEQKKWTEAAVKVVNDAFPFDSDDARTWPECAKLLLHALAAVEQGEALNVGAEATGRLFNQMGLYFNGRTQYAEAKQLFKRALKIGEATLGPDHPNVAIRVNNVGLVLQAQGKLEAARLCYERALRIDEAAFGPDHPNVATDVNNLGSVLQDQGKHEEARQCLERALRIFTAFLGEDHPNTVIVRDNLKLLG